MQVRLSSLTSQSGEQRQAGKPDLRKMMKMPNDAKLGLLLGLVLVVIISVVYFRKEPSAAHASDPATAPSAASKSPVPSLPKVPNPPAPPPPENRDSLPPPPPPQPKTDDPPAPLLPPPAFD